MERDAAYAILSDVVFNGFLCATYSIADHTLVLKTLNDKEFDLIRLLNSPDKGKETAARLTLYYAMYSVFAVDGEPVLENRQQRVKDLEELFYNIPERLLRNINEQLISLREQVLEASKFLEGFSYTPLSRQNWRILHGRMPNGSEVTGIPGTGSLGLNVLQESWVLINTMLDIEEQHNQRFSLALLVASASNPKGVRKVRSHHDTQVKSSEDRRKRLVQEGYVDPGRKVTGWAAPVDTAEELVAELERQMRGEKDKHDVFVDEYMRKLQDQAQKQVKESEERIRKARDPDMPDITGSQRALTPQETVELMQRRGMVQPVMVPSGEGPSQGQSDRFMRKIGSRVLTSEG